MLRSSRIQDDSGTESRSPSLSAQQGECLLPVAGGEDRIRDSGAGERASQVADVDRVVLHVEDRRVRLHVPAG
jgi:hypothetical protein